MCDVRRAIYNVTICIIVRDVRAKSLIVKSKMRRKSNILHKICLILLFMVYNGIVYAV